VTATRGVVARAGAAGAARTPVMAQYARLKAEHTDAFLFFRLGDFYELFFDDAVECAGLLGLTLTSRNKHDPQPIPMCGVPWHQRDAYIARLLRLGRKVAVCDQIEEASQARGLVERAVTEVLTPGSVTGRRPRAGWRGAPWPNGWCPTPWRRSPGRASRRCCAACPAR